MYVEIGVCYGDFAMHDRQNVIRSGLTFQVSMNLVYLILYQKSCTTSPKYQSLYMICFGT